MWLHLAVILIPSLSIACMSTVSNTQGRQSLSRNAKSRSALRNPTIPCSVQTTKLCLEGWICDTSAVTTDNNNIQCNDGSALLFKDIGNLVLINKSQCKNKKWLINDKVFNSDIEVTCGSIVPRGKGIYNLNQQNVAKDIHQDRPAKSLKEANNSHSRPQSRHSEKNHSNVQLEEKELKERLRENSLIRRRLIKSLKELDNTQDLSHMNKLKEEMISQNHIRQELIRLWKEVKRGGHPLRKLKTESINHSTNQYKLPTPEHVPSYAELLALQGYEAMPDIYRNTPPPNPFIPSYQSISSSLSSSLSHPSLTPYSSYRRCGRIRQSTSDCPDGRICTGYKHLGEHRVTCPNGHVAVELSDGHLELMISSLVCPEGSNEWTAESQSGDQGQRIGSDVTITCMQECACTPLAASPVCPPSQTCSPAAFIIDMDDQCMLYECGKGHTLFVRSRYGWQPSSHLVCGPGGEYLMEGKENVGVNPTVTCVMEGQSLRNDYKRRQGFRSNVFINR